LETRDIDMPKLCEYAKSKGIGVWVYVNQRALYQQLDQILPLYEKWGISGIKFGFVQIGSQEWTTWLHNAVKKCADHHILVDIHDEYRPTGWSRTYPNLLSQEGVGGNEEMPDAEHNTILPFTRFLCGPADYTPCYFNGRVQNTKAHQLAMPVVYYSPVTFLYWYDLPNAYKGEKELDFWKYCPTVWDESKALQGEIGEYIVQARRSGNDWFVGAMNGLQARDITLNTADFLQKGKKYQVEIYNDDPTLNTRTKVSAAVQTIKAGKVLKLHLQSSGGAALRFVLVK
jgi:alpha-glucosidase